MDDINTPESTGDESIDSVDNSVQEPVDPTANLKSEMNRKFDNLYKAIEQQNQMLASLNQPRAVAPVESEADLEDLAFSNPKEYARRIKEAAKAEMAGMIAQQEARRAQETQVLTQLASDYPELNNANSELTQRAVAIYNRLSDAEKTSPVAYKVAVRDAAAELGVLPASKRSSSTNEDFVMSSGSGNKPVGKPGQRRSGQDDLDSYTSTFAELVGVDVTNKDVRERIKNYRDNGKLGKWEDRSSKNRKGR